MSEDERSGEGAVPFVSVLPPPRPLVRRAPRAGAQAPDQRLLGPALVGDAGFSGGFLEAMSILRRTRHSRVARPKGQLTE